MATSFLTVKDKLDNKLGFFELLGFDFMLDDSLKVGHYDVPITITKVFTVVVD